MQTLTQAIKAHGLEYLRGKPITSQDGKIRYIHNDDLDSALALWEDEPHNAYQQKRFFGGDSPTTDMVEWIYTSSSFVN
jgi:hypothetical protein